MKATWLRETEGLWSRWNLASVSYFRRGESSCSAKEPIVENYGCYLFVWFSLLWLGKVNSRLTQRPSRGSRIYLNPPLFTTMSQTRKMMSAIKSAVLCNFSVFSITDCSLKSQLKVIFLQHKAKTPNQPKSAVFSLNSIRSKWSVAPECCQVSTWERKF